MNFKTKLLGFFASLSGSIFILTITQIILFVIGDISAGALRGTPETGWGFLISGFFLLPIAIVALVFFILLGRKFKSYSQKPFWVLLVGSMIFAGLIFAGFLIYDKVTVPAENPHDSRLTMDMNNAYKRIDNLYYAKKGNLPTEAEINSTNSAQGITYQVLDIDTFKLCGTFEKSTITDAYKKSAENENSKITKKVVEGETLTDAEPLGVYSLHGTGVQCYTITLRKPVTQ